VSHFFCHPRAALPSASRWDWGAVDWAVMAPYAVLHLLPSTENATSMSPDSVPLFSTAPSLGPIHAVPDGWSMEEVELKALLSMSSPTQRISLVIW